MHFLALIILASCSTTSKNLIPNSNEILKGNSLKNFEDIYDYQSYFESDLEKIQKAIDNQQLNQEELKNAKILKRNYQKILSKKEYTLYLNLNQKYSEELIELASKLNLPINIFWADVLFKTIGISLRKSPKSLTFTLLYPPLNGLLDLRNFSVSMLKLSKITKS